MVVESDEGAVVVDAGVMFPDSELVGVDLVLPEFTYLDRIRESIRGIVLTHGHEDHIGAIPYLLPRIDRVPIIGSDLTLRFLERKLAEFGLASDADIEVLGDRDSISLAGMTFTLYATAHSVPDACGLVIESDDGRILHTGDFKIDSTPLDGRRTDLQLVGKLGESGIDLMLCDSTNAVERGWIQSEREVGHFLKDLFGSRKDRRIVATCFASHLHRIQQIAETAIDFGRKVCFVGRSLERNVAVATAAGKLNIPHYAIVGARELGSIPPEDTCIICTGSQGEPYSSLSLMAAGDHPAIEIGPSDTIVVSSHPIPGNEPAIYRVIDRLYARGAEVLYSEVCPEVHVSGHAAAEDIKMIVSLASPRAFVPIHGEHRHLVSGARLAMEVGVPSGSVFVAKNGDAIVLDKGEVRLEKESVPAGIWYIDSGAMAAAVPEEHLSRDVLRERSLIAKEGMVVVVVTVSAQSGEVMGEIEVVGRGWRDDLLGADRLAELKESVRSAVETVTRRGVTDWGTLKREIRSSASEFLRKQGTGRPLVIPVVIEV